MHSLPPRSDPSATSVDDVLSAEELQVRGSSDRARAANAFLVALTRAARSFLLYDSANGAIHHFLATLATAAEDYRGRFGALSLEVRPFEILSGGEVIYLDRDRERSIAFRLYRDGVRRLDMSADVPWHEVLKLLEILSIRYTGIRQSEDDMVVLLWKAGFVEIQVEAVEGVINEEFDAARIWRASSHVDAPPDFDWQLLTFSEPSGLHYLPVLPADRERLLVEDESPALAALCVQLGSELLSACAAGTLRWHEIAAQMAEIRDFLLSEGVLPHLVALARTVIRTRLATPHENLRRSQFLATFTNEASMARVLRGMRPDSREAPPELGVLFELCPGDHLQTLLELVVLERSEVGRRVARSLIERWVPSHRDMLLERATAGPADLACELLRVFRYADPQLCVDSAFGLAGREELDVQLAVVHALDALCVQTPPRIIQSLLLSPSIEVRLVTLAHVAQQGLRSVFPALLARVARGVASMEQREVDAHAVALAGGDPVHALQTFEEWVRPLGMFRVQTGGQLQLVYAAIIGLARIPGDPAVALIRQVSEQGGSDLKAATVNAMRERRRAGIR